MERRRFLKASVAGGALALPIVSLLAACSNDGPPPEAIEKFFPDSAEVSRLGRAYRVSFPGENDSEILRSLLAELAELSVAEAAIQADFLNGDVVMLDGWILSRTEGRLCALFSLGES